jgi:hypothetical protein
MRFAYTKNPHSAELIVPVVIGGMTSPLLLDYSAKLDTGADITVVPAEVRSRMSVKPSDWARSSGALGQTWKMIPLFCVRIRVVGGEWIKVTVMESPRDYVLLGRDILNQFILTAHGPAGWFELALP